MRGIPEYEVFEKGKTMQENDMDRLPEFLYDIANKIVGKVGEDSKKIQSVTGERHVEFATFFTNSDEAIRKWIVWISAYKTFARCVFSGKIRENNKTLKIYWRALPEIDRDEKSDRYSLYARLLISNEKEIRLLRNHQFRRSS